MLHVMLVYTHIFKGLIEDGQLLVGHACIHMLRCCEVRHMFRQVDNGFIIAIFFECCSCESFFADSLSCQLDTTGAGLLNKSLELLLGLCVGRARNPLAKLQGVMSTLS